MQNAFKCNETNGDASMFFVYKNDPHLDPAFIEYILCKYIIDVYLLKELLGQGGEHTFIGETLKHPQ